MSIDLKIAQAAKLEQIFRIAEKMGLEEQDLDIYGSPYVAKMRIRVINRLQDRPNAKYIVVSAITPTPVRPSRSSRCRLSPPF